MCVFLSESTIGIKGKGTHTSVGNRDWLSQNPIWQWVQRAQRRPRGREAVAIACCIQFRRSYENVSGLASRHSHIPTWQLSIGKAWQYEKYGDVIPHQKARQSRPACNCQYTLDLCALVGAEWVLLAPASRCTALSTQFWEGMRRALHRPFRSFVH